MLTFGARAAIVAITAATASAATTAATGTTGTTRAATATAATPTPALTAVAFAAEVAALRALAFRTWTAIVAETAARSTLGAATLTAAAGTAPTTTAAMRTVAVLAVVAPGFRSCRAADGFGVAAEKAFQPTEEAAGFFLRCARCRALGLRGARLVGPRMTLLARFAGLEFPGLTRFAGFKFTWLARGGAGVRTTFAAGFEFPIFPGFELAVITARLTRLHGFRIATAIALRAEGRPLVAPLGGAVGRCARGFPTDGTTLGAFWRENVELGLAGRFRGGTGFGDVGLLHRRLRYGSGRRNIGRDRRGLGRRGRNRGRHRHGCVGWRNSVAHRTLRGLGASDLGSRFDAGRTWHGGFAGERVLVFALWRDDFERRGLVASRRDEPDAGGR